MRRSVLFESDQGGRTGRGSSRAHISRRGLQGDRAGRPADVAQNVFSARLASSSGPPRPNRRQTTRRVHWRLPTLPEIRLDLEAFVIQKRVEDDGISAVRTADPAGEIDSVGSAWRLRVSAQSNRQSIGGPRRSPTRRVGCAQEQGKCGQVGGTSTKRSAGWAGFFSSTSLMHGSQRNLPCGPWLVAIRPSSTSGVST